MSLLKIEGLTKTFGGVHAIEDLSFTIQAGTIHSVIGPNGAGKTTLFNLITGIYAPTSGKILLEGWDIAHKPPYELAKLGLCRTFQNLQICFNMTAIENVMMGSHLHLNTSFLAALFRFPTLSQGDRECREQAAELMDLVGLSKYLTADADSLPYGALKRLEIARALATSPRLLLLDEPAAGLNPKETAEIDEVIQKICESGVTILLVEHDMKLVMNISDHILVLDYGKKLAEGKAEEIRNNPAVIEAYLG